MTPHEILKHTPMTNCGQCGYPACLAFAANVAKSGEDPQKCPFIDLTNLDLPTQGGLGLDQLSTERDLALIRHLKEKVRDLDLQGLAHPLQASFIDDGLEFSFLGQPTRITKQGVLLAGQEPDDPRDQILLYNYVHFGGGPGPDPTWVGLESLPNSISKVRTLATYCEQPLAEFFSGMDKAEIINHCAPLHGKEMVDSSATVDLIIPVLPQIPQQMLFWDAEPEDGFAAKVKVLFPANVLSFLDIESLVFTAERMAELICDQA